VSQANFAKILSKNKRTLLLLVFVRIVVSPLVIYSCLKLSVTNGISVAINENGEILRLEKKKLCEDCRIVIFLNLILIFLYPQTPLCTIASMF
jgi:hypothetical protein